MLLIEKLTYDVKTTKILLANKMNRKINSSCYPRPFNIHLSIYLFIPFGNLAYELIFLTFCYEQVWKGLVKDLEANF